MSDDNEPLLVGLILFPFRLIVFLGDLVWGLCLVMLGVGALALLGVLLWAMTFQRP